MRARTVRKVFKRSSLEANGGDLQVLWWSDLYPDDSKMMFLFNFTFTGVVKRRSIKTANGSGDLKTAGAAGRAGVCVVRLAPENREASNFTGGGKFTAKIDAILPALMNDFYGHCETSGNPGCLPMKH